MKCAVYKNWAPPRDSLASFTRFQPWIWPIVRTNCRIDLNCTPVIVAIDIIKANMQIWE